tara:strand:+ start:383 stop:520 length:138 start_codon:yes stop_codon:yes gene_type:complete
MDGGSILPPWLSTEARIATERKPARIIVRAIFVKMRKRQVDQAEL